MRVQVPPCAKKPRPQGRGFWIPFEAGHSRFTKGAEEDEHVRGGDDSVSVETSRSRQAAEVAEEQEGIRDRHGSVAIEVGRAVTRAGAAAAAVDAEAGNRPARVVLDAGGSAIAIEEVDRPGAVSAQAVAGEVDGGGVGAGGRSLPGGRPEGIAPEAVAPGWTRVVSTDGGAPSIG